MPTVAAPSTPPVQPVDDEAPDDLELVMAEAASLEQELEAALLDEGDATAPAADEVEVDDDGLIRFDTAGDAEVLQRAPAADYGEVAGLATGAEEATGVEADEAASSADEADQEAEPPWLLNLDLPDDGGQAADDAEVTGGFLDALEDQDGDPEAALPQYVPRLAQYLIGHPASLITKRRKRPGKGSGKRYYAEAKSEDVMADKTVTGCWACGKLDHESSECPFKRCFICSEQGHEQVDCGMKKEWCKRCHSNGHTEEFCPLQAYSEGLDHEVDTVFCRCILTGQEGQINSGEVPATAASSSAKGGGPRAPGYPPWAQKGQQAAQALGNGSWAGAKGSYGKAGGLRPSGGKAAWAPRPSLAPRSAVSRWPTENAHEPQEWPEDETGKIELGAAGDEAPRWQEDEQQTYGQQPHGGRQSWRPTAAPYNAFGGGKGGGGWHARGASWGAGGGGGGGGGGGSWQANGNQRGAWGTRAPIGGGGAPWQRR